MLYLVLLSVPACFALQIYFWIAWRGFWCVIGSLPILAVLGLIHGLVTNSNLWPFWAAEFAPYGAVAGVVLSIVHRASQARGN